MSIETTITCDAEHCNESIESTGTDSIDELLALHNWQHDPDTEEFQYCDKHWPAAVAEYQAFKKELAENRS